jgi:hypothetical protein
VWDITGKVLIRDNNRVIVSDIFRLHEKETYVAKSLTLAVKLQLYLIYATAFSLLNRRIKKDESKIK